MHRTAILALLSLALAGCSAMPQTAGYLYGPDGHAMAAYAAKTVQTSIFNSENIVATQPLAVGVVTTSENGESTGKAVIDAASAAASGITFGFAMCAAGNC
ncbi:MAG TPA: hypothetical protein VFB15_11675 [Candidatus Binataceae bacterium]|jgi:hypothetical protein|nr:hypothetical protein [Candidatus Binataceae bacterium]